MKNNYGNSIQGNYGQHITPQALFKNVPQNPFYNMGKPYVENIYDDSPNHIGNNFGAVQIKGGAGLPDSQVVASRSKGQELGRQTSAQDPYWAGERIFHSERTGLQPLLDEYITSRRQNAQNSLPYDPYTKHSATNIRRPSSPSPKEYLERRPPLEGRYDPQNDYDVGRLVDKSEFEALKNLSSTQGIFGRGKKKTYANGIQDLLNKEKSYINMLSERPSCNNPNEFGCAQFLPNIMPNNSNYGYTSSDPSNTISDRDELYNMYDKNLIHERAILNRHKQRGTIVPYEHNKKSHKKFAKGGNVILNHNPNKENYITLAQILKNYLAQGL